MSRPFEARYAGTCASCDERFAVGDAVRFEDDQLVHDTCTETTPQRPERPACPTCWLVHAGECDR